MRNSTFRFKLENKIRRNIYLIFFSILCFCQFPHFIYSQDISKQISEGNKLIKEKKYDEALKVLTEAKNLDDKSPLPDISLGMLFLIKDDLIEAEKYLKSAELKNPDLDAVRYTLALLYEKKGDRTNSIEYWNKLLKNSNFKNTAKKHIQYLEEGK
ncbi:MAG: hypothetical protein A2539_07960 [Elusimicrobia bacterium RIFOXYD2_FULL_34_15]|nr:MAG: hypothetical protein A2539_07960 [Elusimicrobia bacterium RIFOXYD2_FULL_34_15]